MAARNVPQKLRIVDDATFEQQQYVNGWNAAVYLMGNTSGQYKYPQIGGTTEYRKGWNAAYSAMGVFPPQAYENVRRKR